MSTVLIACSMLEDEIRQIMREEHLNYPVCWMDRGLHASPDYLRVELQTMILRYETEYDTILLGYCLCGNSLRGLSSSSVLHVMDFYDCIHMLISDRNVDKHSLYFTAGWIRSDEFIDREYQYAAARYGKKKASLIYAKILKGYTHLTLIDTKSYPLSEFIPQAEAATQRLHLCYRLTNGSTDILRSLLTCTANRHILRISPGKRI